LNYSGKPAYRLRALANEYANDRHPLRRSIS
jgi:hypothetical protein